MDRRKRRHELVDIALLAISYGFVPIPMKGKRPIGVNWQQRRNDPKNPEVRARNIWYMAGGDPRKKNDQKKAYEAYRTNKQLYEKLVEDKQDGFSGKYIIDNIGVLTGKPSGIIVVDIENSGISFWNEFVELNAKETVPKTFRVKSGGEGYHLYFKLTPETEEFSNMTKLIGQDIDIRGNGGVIVFPGSIHPETGKAYLVDCGYEDDKPILSPMPFWVRGLLLEHLKRVGKEVKPDLIAIDIDKTIANTDKRYATVVQKYNPGSREFHEHFQNGNLFYLDEPVIAARNFLQKYKNCGIIAYISGRRHSTLQITQEWLKNQGFPDGFVMLRDTRWKGPNATSDFKAAALEALKQKYNVLGYIGDDLKIDRKAASKANISFIPVEENKWTGDDLAKIFKC